MIKHFLFLLILLCFIGNASAADISAWNVTTNQTGYNYTCGINDYNINALDVNFLNDSVLDSGAYFAHYYNGIDPPPSYLFYVNASYNISSNPSADFYYIKAYHNLDEVEYYMPVCNLVSLYGYNYTSSNYEYLDIFSGTSSPELFEITSDYIQNNITNISLVQPSRACDWIGCTVQITYEVLAIAASYPNVTDLLIENKTSESRVDAGVTNPYFSWSYSDPNSDEQYSWEINVGTSQGASDLWASGEILGNDTSDIYNGSTLSSNTTYHVQVRVNNSVLSSTWLNGTFKINDLPLVNNILITPGAPVDTDDLVVSNDTATDANGDPVTVYYKWYKDDVHQPALNNIITINSSNTTNGEVWKVGLIPNDTYENGTEVFSATVTIGSGNVAPSIDSIITNVSTKKYGYDILVTTVNAFDYDDDNYTLHVGSATGLSDLCNSSSTANGSEASCVFTVPWQSGAHVVYGRLTDANDTSAEEYVIITVDTTPPVYVSSNVNPSSFISGASGIITASITLDNGTMDYVTIKILDTNLISTNHNMSYVNGTWTYTFAPAPAGSYLVTTIYASDDSGNVMSAQSVSHSITVLDATGGAAGGGKAVNVTVIEVGDLTLDPDVMDVYMWYLALSGNKTGEYTFTANRNLESCRLEPNSYATCEVVDGYKVLVKFTADEDTHFYSGVLTVVDSTDHTVSVPVIIRVVGPYTFIPIYEFNVGPLSTLATPIFETEGTFIVGIKMWFFALIVMLIIFSLFKSLKR